jgi:hypothetical protein
LKKPKSALQSDLIWFFTSIFISAYFQLNHGLDFEHIIISWSFGAIPGFCWILKQNLSHIRFDNSSSNSNLDLFSIFRLGSIGFLSEINTVLVNLIIIRLTSETLLGQFRFYQILLLPVAFLININRVLIIPMLRDKQLFEVSKQLKLIDHLRLTFYTAALISSASLNGYGLSNILCSLLSILSVECAYRRNLRYQFLLKLQNEFKINLNLIFYLLISMVTFSLLSRFESVLLLSFGLAAIELLSFIVIHERKS